MSEQDAPTLWQEACELLQERLHPNVYSRWISVIQAKSLDGDVMTATVDNNFYQTWLEEHYLPLILDALASVCGRKLTLRFEVSHRKPAPAPEAKAEHRPLRERFRKRSTPPPQLNPKFTFNDFVIGSANSFAHAAALAVAQAPARAYNPLFIYGGVGLGKTHLMQAIGRYVLEQSKATVSYVSCEAFTNEYIDALQNRRLIQFRRRYRHTDVLLIDDIHFLAKKEALQEEFFHTFNALFDAHKQVVMTSDRPASDIRGLEQRLVSRFEWGLVAELDPPDFETRVAILRHNLASSRASLPDELITFIAQHVRSNVRRLEGALIRVLSYRSLMGEELNMATVSRLLRDTLELEDRQELSFDRIQRAVAEHYSLRLADLVGKRRPRTIALPRQLAMYLCRNMMQASFPEIGHAFARTHATVLHACRRMDSQIDHDDELRRAAGLISKSLGHPMVHK